MKAMKKTLALAVLLPLTMASASALAYGGGMHHHGGKGGDCGMYDGKRMFSQLDLTAEQQEKMTAMRDANREARRSEMASHRTEMQAQHQKMQQLVLADNFDEVAVRELAKQMSEQQVEHRVTMLKQRHEMFKLLTPEQKTKFQQLQQDRMAQCQARWAEKAKN